MSETDKPSFWDGLRPASFRGVGFDAFDEHNEAGGRRLVRHEFPLRDTPYAEDLGRKAGQWQVEAFVLRHKWADYAAARDALRDALNAAGPGTLIHPWLGEMRVAVDGYSVRESSGEGGYCKFSVTFVEAGSLIEPDVQTDTAAKVEEAADAVEEAAEQSFLDRLNMLAEDVESAAAFVEGLVDTVIGYANAGMQFASRVKATIGKVLALPGKLAGALLGLVSSVLGLGSLFNLGAFDLGGFRAFLARRQDGPGASWQGAAPGAPGIGNTGTSGGGAGSGPSGTTGTGTTGTGIAGTRASTVEDRVYAPIIDYVAAVTVAALARRVAATDFATADDALAALDIVTDAVDAVQEARCEDRVYTALDDMRVAVTADVAARGAKLPRLGTARLAATMPALAASYRLYGTAAHADELVARNRVRHPGRVPGGVDLEIVRHE